ncbi:hypothetical protein ACJJTC_012990 [Scirpophaga incertulas]
MKKVRIVFQRTLRIIATPLCNHRCHQALKTFAKSCLKSGKMFLVQQVTKPQKTDLLPYSLTASPSTTNSSTSNYCSYDESSTPFTKRVKKRLRRRSEWSDV